MENSDQATADRDFVREFYAGIEGWRLTFWLLIAVAYVIMQINATRWRVQRRRRNDPFKDMKPLHSEISCPRCGAPWPEGYQPVSHREHMWKGVICGCGCQYDDYGRERQT
jgi:hypothetical protein